ncbi:hypothetical protein ACFL6I_05425 [candidate division KSB1 bacterium]
MKYVLSILAVVLVPALTTLVAADQFHSWNAWAIVGVWIGTSVLMIVVLPGMGLRNIFFGTQVRGSLTCSILGALFGAGLVWSFDQSGSIKPDELKTAYIFMSTLFTVGGLLISFYPDYPKK